jgi:DNA repair protein RecN (Recombination protein N)
MLNYLQIRDYAIVDSLDLEFSEGFTCITGETGAGKSILVGALGLICGNRADISAIRAGASRAELSAEFDLPEECQAALWLKKMELGEGGSCLLRRLLGANGRSRAWINGTAVTLQQLSELGELLVEIHGQNEHLRLVRSREQFRLLDGGGSHDGQLARLDKCFQDWRELDAERENLLRETPLDAGDRELLQYQIRELEDNMLGAAEFLALESEHRKLAQGGAILDTLEWATNALEAEPSGSTRTIHKLAAGLETHAALDKDISEAAGLLREAAINCDEALNSIQAAKLRMDLSPERLRQVEEKLGVQHDLARKHRVEPDQLSEVLSQLESRFDRAGSLEQRLGQLEEQLESALLAYREAAAELHASRTARAAELSSDVTDLMQELGMQGGRFEFIVRQDPDGNPSERGDDRLELRVSANPGTSPGPLRKVASGGELSRISLAIKVASRTGPAVATQVFDEVDAGIGGETAHSVGALLRSLSANSQALCVTHLAQVAVFADQQLQVHKSSDDLETRVATSVLSDNERVDEIARMLGGKLSDQSRAHATELLATAATRH